MSSVLISAIIMNLINKTNAKDKTISIEIINQDNQIEKLYFDTVIEDEQNITIKLIKK